MPRVHIDRITSEFYILRLDDNETKYFEALWYIPEGVTYNSYLLVTADGAVLFDTWKATYADLFVETLRKVIDLRDLKYIVIHHMEPDHSGALPKLLNECCYKPTLVGHPLVKNMLSSFYGIEAPFRAVRDLDTLVVGNTNLRFIYIPWLHWPETIATYIENLRALLTCDAFGGFGVLPALFDDDDSIVEKYLPMVRKYVVTVVGHYREHIVKNIEKIRKIGIDIGIVAPSHGLVWRRRPYTVIDYYARLAKAEPMERKVVVVYSSMYGFVEQSINIVLEELSKRGFAARVFAFRDRERAEVSDIISEAIDAYAIVVGASTYENKLFPEIEHVLRLLVHKVNAEKPLLVLSTYGWGSVAENRVKNLLEGSRFRLIDVVSIRGRLQKDDVERIRKAVTKLLQ